MSENNDDLLSILKKYGGEVPIGLQANFERGTVSVVPSDRNPVTIRLDRSGAEVKLPTADGGSCTLSAHGQILRGPSPQGRWQITKPGEVNTTLVATPDGTNSAGHTDEDGKYATSTVKHGQAGVDWKKHKDMLGHVGVKDCSGKHPILSPEELAKGANQLLGKRVLEAGKDEGKSR